MEQSGLYAQNNRIKAGKQRNLIKSWLIKINWIPIPDAVPIIYNGPLESVSSTDPRMTERVFFSVWHGQFTQTHRFK